MKDQAYLDHLKHTHDNYGLQALVKELDSDTQLTLSEVGYVLGITRERVRQIESSAIRKLKHPRIGAKLRDYLSYGIDIGLIKNYGE